MQIINENESLVSQYQNGNHMALDELTKNNMKLIEFIARKYYIGCKFIDQDDLIQQGWIGFLRAVETYRTDLQNSAKFSTWAVYWIRQAIQRYLEQKTPKTEEISLFEEIEEGIKIEDTIQDPEAAQRLWSYIERRELRRELEAVMNERLSLKEREVIKLRFGWGGGEGLDFSTIGELYKEELWRVKANYQRALKKLQESPWGRMRLKEHLMEKGIKHRHIPTKITIYERVNEI